MKRRIMAAVLMVVPTIAWAAASVPDFSGLGYEQRLGNQIPMRTELRDESGALVRLSDLPERKPLVLVLGYFRCPNLCSVVRSDLFDALRASGMDAERDYSLVALSIDASETSADAREAKDKDLAAHGAEGAGWHFLTGTADAIGAVADAVGFHDRFDSQLKQFVHPVGIVFTTRRGIVSSYLLGVGYQPLDVRLGIARAREDSIAAAALPVLLLCYHYDATTGRYTISILKVLRLAAALTLLLVGLMLFLAFRAERARS